MWPGERCGCLAKRYHGLLGPLWNWHHSVSAPTEVPQPGHQHPRLGSVQPQDVSRGEQWPKWPKTRLLDEFWVTLGHPGSALRWWNWGLEILEHRPWTGVKRWHIYRLLNIAQVRLLMPLSKFDQVQIIFGDLVIAFREPSSLLRDFLSGKTEKVKARLFNSSTFYKELTAHVTQCCFHGFFELFIPRKWMIPTFWT